MSPPASTARRPIARRPAGVLTAGLLAALLGGCGVQASDPGTTSTTRTAAAVPPNARLQTFVTRPDLRPTAVTFKRRDPSGRQGYVFTAPKSFSGQKLDLAGPMILDGRGRLVWFKPVDGGAYNFTPQTYRGRPVLTWWQGEHQRGFGYGENVIYDEHYRQIATVKAGNGQKADFHDFKITPQDTALLVAYRVVPADLTGIRNGTRNDLVLDNTVQEVDIATGKVLVEWHSAKEIAPSESYASNPKDPKLPWDYVHINSVDVDDDGNLIVSGRGTHAYYKINRTTGETMWRMGGKKSDFTMGPGARTAFQHDLRNIGSGRFTAFDNNAQVPVLPVSRHQSRGVVLDVDEDARTVTLEREILHGRTPFQAPSQGNMQTLPGGDVFLGWGGRIPVFTQVDGDDRVVLEGRFASGGIDSYRAFRAPWVGRPLTRPDVVAKATADGTSVWVSWNGATQVRRWRVRTGADAGTLTTAATVPWAGFETRVDVPSTQPAVQVQALDRDGRVVGTSATVTAAR